MRSVIWEFCLLILGGLVVLLYAIFIILDNYICLYTSSTPFLCHLCLKVNKLVVTLTRFGQGFVFLWMFKNDPLDSFVYILLFYLPLFCRCSTRFWILIPRLFRLVRKNQLSLCPSSHRSWCCLRYFCIWFRYISVVFGRPHHSVRGGEESLWVGWVPSSTGFNIAVW